MSHNDFVCGGVGRLLSRGIIGDRRPEGGTGLGECEGFRLYSECIGGGLNVEHTW